MTEDDQLEMPESDSESKVEEIIRKIKEKKAEASATSGGSSPVNEGFPGCGSVEDPEITGEGGAGGETEARPENLGSEGEDSGTKENCTSECELLIGLG